MHNAQFFANFAFGLIVMVSVVEICELYHLAKNVKHYDAKHVMFDAITRFTSLTALVFCGVACIKVIFQLS